MATEPLTVVCFAVKQEAGPFQRAVKPQANFKVLITGMGRRNAEQAVRHLLEQARPRLVISSGFAGALRPDLVSGTVVYDADPDSELAPALIAAGAHPVRFICSGRVASSAMEKSALRKSTGADAIEMESEPIRTICRERHIPCVTVRAILDAAHEDLPLDFNQLMTNDQQLDWRKLFLALVKSPHKLAALLHLQNRSAATARGLSRVLLKALGA